MSIRSVCFSGGVLCNHHGMKETGTFSISKLWQKDRIESELSHNSAQKKGEHIAATLKQNLRPFFFRTDLIWLKCLIPTKLSLASI